MDGTQSELNKLLRVQSPRIPDGHNPPEGNLALVPHGVKDGSIVSPGKTLLLDSDQYTTNTIGLYFGTNESDWQRITSLAGKEIDAIFGRRQDAPVNLLVTVTNTRLRIHEVLIDVPFDTWVGNESSWKFDLVAAGNTPDRPRSLRMPQDGCTLTIQFVLRSDLPEKLRVRERPWRKGSWLAKWEVKISAAKGSGLAPRPLTKEVRDLHGLGNSCTTFIDFRGEQSGICLKSDLTEILAVYIDEELLNSASALDRKGGFLKPAGGAVLNRIVMDTNRALVLAISHDDELDSFDLDSDDHKRTFTYHLLGKVSSYADISEAEALLILKDQPHKFLAILEGSIDLLGSDKSLLELKGK